MPIRKTGSATGQVTGIEKTPEDEERQLRREAARQPWHTWDEKDERELAAENDDAAPGL